MMPALVITGGVLLVVLIFVVLTYNRFVSTRQHMKESWADIDVELKRRYELIPNLVETVKGYARHEAELMARVVELRNQAAANHGDAASQARDETTLMRAMKQFFVVVEAYPDLKASARFADLQTELADTEDRIAAARRFFNANVRELNQLCLSFPSNLIAGMFGFSQASFFELASDAERVVPRVEV
ncbi:MAG: LemA family protein [Phycisphaerales bacterium]|nr:LemA family protein [Phycisphaerales bacterium]